MSTPALLSSTPLSNTNANMNTDNHSSPLLSLPQELLTQILLHIFPPSHLQTLTIRSLFLRAHYRHTYMTQFPKHLNDSLAVLSVNRQLSAQALEILYGYPMWRCVGRIAELGSQIGFENFRRIRRMEVGFEDLGTVVGSLRHEVDADSGGSGIEFHPGAEETEEMRWKGERGSAELRFGRLEVLVCEGYQGCVFDFQEEERLGENKPMAIPAARALWRARVEAIRLFGLARRIMELHPLLNVLVQQDAKHGGADAVDLSMGRVRWRFVRNIGCLKENEHAVDVDNVVRNLEKLLDEQKTPQSMIPAAWMENGSFRQHHFVLLAPEIGR